MELHLSCVCVYVCVCVHNVLCCFYHPGAVGLPFKYVNFMIGVYNAYVKGEYEVIVEGNQKEVTVTEGGSVVALSRDDLYVL